MDNLSSPRPWPAEIGLLHAISISKARRDKFVRRCRRNNISIDRDVQLCAGVNGNALSRRHYLKNGWLHSDSVLSRGQIGCWESHKALWKKQVSDNIPFMFIAEDDTCISNTRSQRTRLGAAFNWLEKHRGGKWDALFVTRSNLKKFTKTLVSRNLGIPGEFWGLNAYILSIKGAKKLLADSRSNCFDLPVDVVIARMCRNDQLESYCCTPCVYAIQKENSATNGII
jgi:GR25 family glycosyltransferase involved in LPS biosynthesis